MIYCLVGPSGSGKNTLGEKVFEPLGIRRLVTHTTRGIRSGEKEGLSYYFTTVDNFKKIPKIEYATYAGNYYGLSVMEVELKLKGDQDVYVILEQQGARKLKELYKENVTIIFVKISQESMLKRIKERGDNEKDVLDRIKNASETNEFSFDAADYVIENENLSTAEQSLLELIKKTSH